MKYRIIHERDDNGHRHYEAEYQTIGWFGITKWKPIVEGVLLLYWPKRFSSMSAAEAAVRIHIRSMSKTRTVVQQGCVPEQTP